jgi:hypothetical protein
VLADRKVKALGREKILEMVSRAAVDFEGQTVKMTYPEDAATDKGFAPKEVAFVGDVGVAEGELRLSLWGIERGGSLTSRRASFSRLKHGELRVGIAALSRRESQKRFEEDWENRGTGFVFPLLEHVVAYFHEGETASLALTIADSLIGQESTTAPHDAFHSLQYLYRRSPDDKEIPLLAARAGASWVKRRLEELRGKVSEEERAALVSALASSKNMVKKAAEMKANKKKIQKAETDIAEAEKLLARTK